MINLHTLDFHRDTSQPVIALYGTAGDDKNGVFRINGMLVVASADDNWEHVSVSRRVKCPSWEDMEYIKRMFFKPDETCMQLHPALSNYVNNCVNCLHIWRPIKEAIPLPPKELV